jgi:hypothetical protein
MSNAAPDLPPMKEYKSAQYEFNDEQNREFSSLADAMRVTAGLLQLAGLAFVVLAAMTTIHTANTGNANIGGYGPAIGLGAAALLSLCVGFWTGGAADSFRKIAETKNEDVWHLMNAVGSLRSMYGLMRFIILSSLVLAVIGLGLVAFGMIK